MARLDKKKTVLLGLFFLAIVLYLSCLSYQTTAQDTEKTCSVYITGAGCPHCAKTDPVVLLELIDKYPNFIVIEYEIYQQQENGQLILSYDANYNSGLGIPLIVFNKESFIIGDRPIVNNAEPAIIELEKNPCPLPNGSSIAFEDLDITNLPGKPKIWTNKRILIKSEGSNINNDLLKQLLTAEIENLTSLLNGIDYSVIEPLAVALSGKNAYFKNAIQFNGWLFQWNGTAIETKCPSCPKPSAWSECENNIKTRTNYKCSKETNYTCIAYTETEDCIPEDSEREKLTVVKLISLAAVDAINPCALAVLTLMLVAILTYNPRKRRNILLAGLAFIISVFIMYLIYGLVIIRFFQFIQLLTVVRIWIYKILGGIAMALGILNIKDFFKYRPGGPCTEMPLMMRPKVKRIISSITSPRGAFGVGIFVTIFLLPCTIGPYIVAGGLLSAFELIKTMPWLLLYNLIFILPMLVITFAVYTGFTRVEDVSGWKEKNIRNLHLIAGIIMFALGLAMLVGWV